MADDVKQMLTIDKDEARKIIEGDKHGIAVTFPEKAGDYVLEKTGSPLAATVVKTGLQMAPMIIGGTRARELPENFSTISAQIGPKAMPEARVALAADLKNAGMNFHETQGTYGGASEPSFMVEHNGSPEARTTIENLGRKYGQESVLHSSNTPQGRMNELQFSDKRTPMTGIGEGSTESDFTDSPIYGKYQLNLGNSPEKFIHYSNTPGLKSIDPSMMGSSGVRSAQTKHGMPEQKSSFYYEESGTPEDIVTQNAKAKYTTALKPGQKVYDLSSDPESVIKAVKDSNQGAFNEDMLHQHLQNQGYDGVKWDQGGTKVIQMYKPMDVEKEEAMAEGGAIGYDEGGSVGLPPGFELDAPAQPQAQTTLPQGFELNEEPPTGIGESLKAGAEGLARGVVGPLAPYLEHKAGVLNRDIKRRAEMPAALAGETAGLVGGTLLGTGEGGLMAHAGEATLEAMNLAKSVGYMAKIGSSTVQAAVESALLGASDQASKSLYDPELSTQNALSAVGLTAALGGAAGAFTGGVLSPLWKATVGNKVENLLKGITERFGGVEGGTASTANDLEQQAGVQLRPEFKALIDRKPGALTLDSSLSQDDVSHTGRKYQALRQDQMAQLEDAVAQTFGTTSDEVAAIPQVDKYNTGRSLADTINAELQPEVENIAKRYETTVDALGKKTGVSEVDKREMADKIAQLSLDQGWDKAQNKAAQRFAKETIEALQDQMTADDLKKFITNLSNDNPYGAETYQAAKMIRGIVRDQQDQIISRWLGPEQLGEYTALRGQYKQLIEKMENLDTHLKVGRWDGPESFMRAVDEMGTANGEAVLRRLSGEGKANVLDVLNNFPRTLSALRQYHVNNLLTDAAAKPTTEMGRININRLNAELQKMSPQVRGLITTPEMQNRLSAVQGIVDGMKDPNHNWSNTARTIHNMTAANPSPLSLLAALMGHGDVGLLSYFGHLGMNEAIPAVKYSLMKFLGSKSPTNVEGFKAMAAFADRAIKGQLIMQRATNNVFKSGAQVLTANLVPDIKDRQKLDKLVAKIQNDPSQLMKLMNSQTGHYLPQQQVALSQSMTNASQYLAKLKPQPYRSAPLDKMIQPTSEQLSRYHRALDIANQPAVVLQSVKDGTLTPTDLQDLQAMYPAVYKQLSQMLQQGVLGKQDDEESIPYHTRMGLSLFLGQPLDSTMTPQNVLSAQPQPKQVPVQQAKPSKQGEMKMSKGSKAYMTPTQNAEADRSQRSD